MAALAYKEQQTIVDAEMIRGVCSNWTAAHCNACYNWGTSTTTWETGQRRTSFQENNLQDRCFENSLWFHIVMSFIVGINRAKRLLQGTSCKCYCVPGAQQHVGQFHGILLSFVVQDASNVLGSPSLSSGTWPEMHCSCSCALPWEQFPSDSASHRQCSQLLQIEHEPIWGSTGVKVCSRSCARYYEIPGFTKKSPAVMWHASQSCNRTTMALQQQQALF